MIEFIIKHFAEILIVAFVYSFIKDRYVSHLTLKTQYRIYALRDKVRRIAIDNPKYEEGVFSYLDSTCSKAIGDISRYDILIAGYYSVKERLFGTALVQDDDKMVRAVEQNKLFKKCLEEYRNIISTFTKKRRIWI